MIRTIELADPIVDVIDVETIIEIFPEIKDCFSKYKYDMLYRAQDEITITIDQLVSITEEFEITITSSTIKIMN